MHKKIASEHFDTLLLKNKNKKQRKKNTKTTKYFLDNHSQRSVYLFSFDFHFRNWYWKRFVYLPIIRFFHLVWKKQNPFWVIILFLFFWLFLVSALSWKQDNRWVLVFSAYRIHRKINYLHFFLCCVCQTKWKNRKIGWNRDQKKSTYTIFVLKCKDKKIK